MLTLHRPTHTHSRTTTTAAPWKLNQYVLRTFCQLGGCATHTHTHTRYSFSFNLVRACARDKRPRYASAHNKRSKQLCFRKKAHRPHHNPLVPRHSLSHTQHPPCMLHHSAASWQQRGSVVASMRAAHTHTRTRFHKGVNSICAVPLTRSPAVRCFILCLPLPPYHRPACLHLRSHMHTHTRVDGNGDKTKRTQRPARPLASYYRQR